MSGPLEFRLKLVRLFIWVLLLPAGAFAAAPDANQRLAAFFDTAWQRELAASPELQAHLGIKTADYRKWDDHSDAQAQRDLARAKSDLDALHAGFKLAELSETSRLSYRTFEFIQEQRIRDFPYRFHTYPVSHLENIATEVSTFLQNIHRIDTGDDAEAYIQRLRGVETVMSQYVDRIAASRQHGVVPPSLVFPAVLADTRALLSGAPFDDSGRDSVLLADFSAKLAKVDLRSKQYDRLIAEAEAALTGPFRSGCLKYLAAVEEYQKAAHGNDGAWALPDGAAYYSNQILSQTTVSRPAEEIHSIGLHEVAQIRKQMEAIRKATGFAGTLDEFFVHLRNDPNSYYTNDKPGRDQFFSDSRRYIDNAMQIAPRYFRRLPKTTLEVRTVEKWREKTSPTAFYEEPSPDGRRPGMYYINMADMRLQQKFEAQTVAHHEGVPGHHFQIALAMEATDTPMFQRYGGFNAYSEGWALYAERLAHETGLVTEPLNEFGRLSNEMLRAVRLVVDSGMHAKHWSREQATAYFLANMPMSEATARAEIDRYLVWPGQALSYRIGMLKILELRDKAKARLGDRFDIRDFHEAVLRPGAVPLPVLEISVDEYIDNTLKARAAAPS